MNEWLLILDIQGGLATDLAAQLSIAMSRSWFGPATARRVVEAVGGQKGVAIDILHRARAAGDHATASEAEAVLRRWDDLLEKVADAKRAAADAPPQEQPRRQSAKVIQFPGAAANAS